ncbi:polyamine transporter tpo5 [Friedmanniomyces endolithicus]|nr:polyamine transporter tpo5 [Friedmanniomyces endolithicus]
MSEISSPAQSQQLLTPLGVFSDGTGTPGWATTASPAYVACIGILMSQYTITGFDASAHLSEETRNASWSAPLGVLTSIICSSVFGFFLILCLLFSIQDFDSTIASTVGQPVLQILLDIFSEDGAIVLFTLVIICVWHCGLFSMTSNSRMMFAFSRDHGIPRWFHYVDARFHSPVRTIWLAATLAFILALPSLGSSVAFAAATSIATIALYVSYGLPILIGLIWHKNFKKGPFNLGVFSRPVALVACLWIGFISIIFCLPNVDPVTSQTLNYTPVAVGIVALWTFGSWYAFARKYFTGPIRQIQAEEAGVDIDEPGALERAEIEGKIDKL